MTAVEAAIEYISRGLAVFPCHGVVDGRCTCGNPKCNDIGKHPRTLHGFLDATLKPHVARLMFGTWPESNVAVRTGAESGLVVLDVDPRAGGNETLEQLEAMHGTLPESPASLTGGGGLHLLFRHPGRYVKSLSGVLGPGLDVKADGGYIIVPPSAHASGRAYAWNLEAHPDDVPLAPLPAWIEQAVGTDAPSAVAEPIHARTLENPGENKRHDALRGEVMRLRSFLPMEECRGIAHALAHRWGMEPGRESEVDGLVDGAYRRAAVRVVTEFDRKVTGGGLSPELIVPLSAVTATPPEFDAEIIARRRALHLIWGAPGGYKTYLVLLLVLMMTQTQPGALALGVGGFAIRRNWRRVLWLGDEETAGELRSRVEILARGHGLRPPAGDELLFADATNGEAMLDIRHVPRLVEMCNPDVVICDPLANLAPMTDEQGRSVKVDLDNTHALTSICRPLRRLCKQADLALFLLHHPNASGDRERGPTAYRGSADVVAKLGAEGPLVTLDFGKARDSMRGKFYFEPMWSGHRTGRDNPLRLRFEPKQAPASTAEANLPDTAKKLLAGLRATGPTTEHNLASAIPGVHRTTRGRNLSLLASRKLVERMTDGRWIARAQAQDRVEVDA